jgi:hypothetical protein
MQEHWSEENVSAALGVSFYRKSMAHDFKHIDFRAPCHDFMGVAYNLCFVQPHMHMIQYDKPLAALKNSFTKCNDGDRIVMSTDSTRMILPAHKGPK